MDTFTTPGSGPWMAAFEEVCSLGARIRDDEFSAFVRVLMDTERRWFVTGQGRSGLVGAMIAMRLMHIGRDCHAAGEPTAPSIRTGDGLLVISGSGSTATSVHHARTAHSEAATVAAVTAMPDSPLGRIADVCLQIPAEGSAQLGGSLFEQAALLVLDSVVNTLAAKVPDARERLRYLHANLQ